MKHLIVVLLFFSCACQAQTISEKGVDTNASEAQNTSSQSEEQKDTIFIQGKFKDVLALAQKENKGVLLHFGADWCLPCKQMKRMTYPNSMVKEKVDAGYLPFEVDVDFFWGMDIAEDFGVNKYPTVILLKPNGKEKSRHEGYIGPREMYRLLRNY